MSRASKLSVQESDPLRFIQGCLGHVLDSAREALHPALYQRLIRQIGERMGHAAFQQYQQDQKPALPPSAEDYAQFIRSLRQHLGWDCSVQEATDEVIRLSMPSCPFGQQPTVDPSICLLESGMLGGVAADLFGQSKVAVHLGEGSPPQNCRMTVYLKRTAASRVAEGVTYPDNGAHRHGQAVPARHDSQLTALSRRERQVLKLLGEGLSNKEVAETLHLSVRTVEGHLYRLRAKLEVRGRTDLLRLALRSKLTSL